MLSTRWQWRDLWRAKGTNYKSAQVIFVFLCQQVRIFVSENVSKNYNCGFILTKHGLLHILLTGGAGRISTLCSKLWRHDSLKKVIIISMFKYFLIILREASFYHAYVMYWKTPLFKKCLYNFALWLFQVLSVWYRHDSNRLRWTDSTAHCSSSR